MSAEEPGSITRWLKGLKEGQPEAVEAIWNRYFQRVLTVRRCRWRGGRIRRSRTARTWPSVPSTGWPRARWKGGSSASTTAPTSGRSLAVITLRKADQPATLVPSPETLGWPVAGPHGPAG